MSTSLSASGAPRVQDWSPWTWWGRGVFGEDTVLTQGGVPNDRRNALHACGGGDHAGNVRTTTTTTVTTSSTDDIATGVG